MWRGSGQGSAVDHNQSPYDEGEESEEEEAPVEMNPDEEDLMRFIQELYDEIDRNP